MGTRLNGLLSILSGWLLGSIGYAMYLQPHIDWQSLVEVWQGGIREVVRLSNDYFALIGGIVFLIGFVLVGVGLKRLILGGRKQKLKKFELAWEGDRYNIE